MRYGVVIEKAERNYSAYVPDLPGCVATGSTVEETEREIRDAFTSMAFAEPASRFRRRPQSATTSKRDVRLMQP